MPVSQFRRGRKTGPSDIYIATPSGSGQPQSNYVAALAQTFEMLAQKDIAADYELLSLDCHVDDARNSLVRRFLMTEAKKLVFIDDDVGWEPESFFKLISFDDADVVGGAYPLKQNQEDYPVRLFSGDLKPRKDGLVEVEGLPTGFMCITREMLLKLEKEYEHTKFWGRGVPKTERPHTIIFERTYEDNFRWSGDYSFCRKVRKAGGKVWCAPEMHFSHQGPNTWYGHFGNFLRNIANVPHPGVEAALKKIQQGDPVLRDFAELFVHWSNAFAAGPTMLKACYDLALKEGGPILEAGAGLTTLVMGMAADISKREIHTLEHDIEWYIKIRRMLRDYNINSVWLYNAPLKEYEDCIWYDFPEDYIPAKFDLAICDGPPRRFGRRGMFKIMKERIEDALWIVDDVDDSRELAMLEHYAGEAGREIEVVGNSKDGTMRQFAVAKAPAAEARSSAA